MISVVITAGSQRGFTEVVQIFCKGKSYSLSASAPSPLLLFLSMLHNGTQKGSPLIHYNCYDWKLPFCSRRTVRRGKDNGICSSKKKIIVNMESSLEGFVRQPHLAIVIFIDLTGILRKMSINLPIFAILKSILKTWKAIINFLALKEIMLMQFLPK